MEAVRSEVVWSNRELSPTCRSFIVLSAALTTMKERQVGDSSLFDQTTTLLTASMGSANSHNFDDLPALVFDSRMKTTGHWRKRDEPMSNLYLGLLQQFGAERDRFGESTGVFDLLA